MQLEFKVFLSQFIEAGLVRGGKGHIAITQPRRVAAVSIASRVADEIGCR